MSLLKILFWAALFLILYTYLIYPILIAAIAVISNRDPKAENESSSALPTVTVIIPVYNEEKWIGLKLENTLALDYPRNMMNVLVISDGCNDKTVDIAEQYASRNVRTIHFEQRTGKIATLDRVIRQANGEIVLITDASAMLQPESLGLMVAHFRDPHVGCVSGDRVCTRSGSSATEGESLYLRYERWIKRSENRVQSSLGGYGPILAVRRRLIPILSGATDDFYIPMQILLSSGERTVFEPRATAAIPAATTLQMEFERKIRTHLAFICDLPRLRQGLNPLKSKVCWQLWSHQVTRLFVPVGMIVALTSSTVLWDAGPVYRTMLVGQLVLYAMAAAGLVLSLSKTKLKWRPAYVCFYFALANTAVGLAWFRWVGGQRPELWHRTERTPPSFASARHDQGSLNQEKG